MPGNRRMVAFPAEVNCAVPNKWISEQWAAAASQKFTVPGVTGVAPGVTRTDAVNVTSLPEATVVTGIPAEVTASVVVVGAGAALAALTRQALQNRKRAVADAAL